MNDCVSYDIPASCSDYCVSICCCMPCHANRLLQTVYRRGPVNPTSMGRLHNINPIKNRWNINLIEVSRSVTLLLSLQYLVLFVLNFLILKMLFMLFASRSLFSTGWSFLCRGYDEKTSWHATLDEQNLHVPLGGGKHYPLSVSDQGYYFRCLHFFQFSCSLKQLSCK